MIAMDGPCPIFRIQRERDDLWILNRPRGALPHGFPTAQAAVVFARREIQRAHAPAWIQVWIGDMDCGAYFDPDAPAPVFGIDD
jgi:hypothetical protein